MTGRRRSSGTRLLLGVALALTLAGCWNRREVNDVALVSGVGVDLTESGAIQVTVQILKPLSLGGQEQTTAAAGKATFTATATGATVFDAIRHVSHLIPRKPGWQHNNVIILGEEFARSGVGDALDFFIRDHEARLDQWVLVARGEAAAALSAQFDLEPNAGLGLRRVYRNGWLFTGEVTPVRLVEFMLAVSSPATAPVAAVIEPLRPGEKISGQYPPESAFRIGGAAVFNQDRLAGWLNDQDVRGLQWLRGKVVNAVIRVPCQKPSGNGIGMEILSSRSRLVPEWPAGSRPQVRARIEVLGRLGDVMCQEDLSQPDAIAKLKDRTAAVIRAEAEATMQKLQADLQADAVGIGEALHRAYPRSWPEWRRRWAEVYPTIRVIPEVRVELTHIGSTLGRPIPGGAPSAGGR